MMLADDEACTLIEPIAAHKAELPLLYDGALMLNGGHLAGWAVEDPCAGGADQHCAGKPWRCRCFAARGLPQPASPP